MGVEYNLNGEEIQKLVLTVYDKENLERKELSDLDELKDLPENKVVWLDIIGLSKTETIKKLGDRFNIHPLIQEDILNLRQIPKVEEYEGYIFTVLKNIFFNNLNDLQTEQISIILMGNLVVSIQEYDTDTFQNTHKRLEESKGVRKELGEELYYLLIDAMVDNYFIILEEIGDRIDKVEDELLDKPEKSVLNRIYFIKRELIFFRTVLWPTRNLVSALTRAEFSAIDKKNLFYYRDIYDHVIQMIDIAETYRDICSGMLDTYLSSIGFKTNEVMKILTIFSTIFIPLTFLSGVYGMNFVYFPELAWKYSYLGFWIISILITVFMLRFLRKKGWL
ncbi:MAG: magnesium/cobalt transporter CorA [Gudongella sp.]|nr:magnesium/cobalt transporter CorA [Gudongella sp.]